MNIIKLSKNTHSEKYNIKTDIATKSDLNFEESLSVAKQAQAKMTVDAMIKEGQGKQLDLATVQNLFGIKQNYARTITPYTNKQTNSSYVPKDTTVVSSGKVSQKTLDMGTEAILATATGKSYASGVLTVPDEYKPIFEEAAAKYNVDEKFLEAVAMAESSFNPNDVSHSGAVGIMQLMPATAEFLGVEDSYDPYQNIMGGAKYLSQLLKRFNGNYALAAAGYNAGGAAVDKYDGLPPYTETQNYVVTVLDYYKNR